MENIYPYDIDKYIGKNNVLIIDLRKNSDYLRKHIRGSINISSEDIEKDLYKIPRNKIIVVYCQSGGRSITVARYLARKGYKVKNVIGGIKNYNGSSLT